MIVIIYNVSIYKYICACVYSLVLICVTARKGKEHGIK